MFQYNIVKYGYQYYNITDLAELREAIHSIFLQSQPARPPDTKLIWKPP